VTSVGKTANGEIQEPNMFFPLPFVWMRDHLSVGLSASGFSSWASRSAPALGTGEIVVAHATRDGTARRFAEATARALEAGGQSVELAALGVLRPEDFRGRRALLILAETTGEGELTEGARRFLQRLTPGSLGEIRFALLTLGGRGDGALRRGDQILRGALRAAGGREAAPMARAEGEATAVWTAWLQELCVSLRLRFGGAAPDEVAAKRFRIVGRGRLDEPIRGDTQETWSLILEAETELDFHPGDILRIAPAAGGRERSYSIGSSSVVDPRLVVLTLRLHRHVDEKGALGYGRVSGELIRDTPLGGLVLGRLQQQPAFRPPADPMQPIVMIAAGSGVAPFPGFLDEREASGWAGPAWLIFGNRHRRGDFLWDERFQAALRDGSLTRLDTAFSRDADDGDYVHDRLREQANELRRWLIEDGALVYICGRREMTREVEATIAAILAESAEPMREEHRIRVDAFD